MKKIISTILVACMILSLSICLLSCNGGGEGSDNTNSNNNQTTGKVTYTVTVVDNNGNPVKDAQIFLSPEGGVAFPMPTDNSGKVSYKTDKKLTASVLSVPDGYEYADLNTSLTFDANGAVTVVVTKVEITGTDYVIRVVDQNGDAVVGAKVQMCEAANEGICLVPITTDDKGEAVYTVEEKAYKAAITSLPAGYELVSDDYVQFVDGVATITVNKI